MPKLPRLHTDHWLILLITLPAFLLFLGAPPLFDWDEINFAESAREMIATGDYFRVRINYEPFWEKPPLFFWLQVLSMKLFGVGEFAARLPNALIGVVTVLALYQTGLGWKDRTLARLLALFYLATLLPVIYFKTGIIDPVFNFFIFLGLMQVMRYERLRGQEASEEVASAPWAAGFWIGLATLTKGPVALLVSVLVYGLYKAIFDRFRLPWGAVGKFLAGWAILVLSWYGLETLMHGSWFLERFFEYQLQLFSQGVAGHEQPFYYHAVVFVLGCMPMSAFAIRGMFQRYEDPNRRMLYRFALVWFWTVMVIFSAATTKIIHYSSLLYFPGAILAGLYVYQLKAEKRPVTWDTWLLLGVGILLWGLGPSLLNVLTSRLPEIAAALKDPFAAENLRMEVSWTGWEWLIGAGFLLGLLFNLRFLVQRRYANFLLLHACLTLAFVNLTYKVVVPKVAQYTQGAPLAFYRQLAPQDVYVMTVSYKSYLPYFYSRVRPHDHPQATDKDWLREGSIDKDVYMSTKIHKVNPAFLEHYRQFERLYEQGGFVFFRRTAHGRQPVATKP